MEARQKKQLIIGIIFALIVGGISYSIVDSLFLVEATCFDEVQNGKEEGVDCGFLACGIACQEPVKPLEILSEKLFQIRPGDYDFVAHIYNPNTTYGGAGVSYILTTSAGTRSGNTYILPGQTKYLVLTSIRSQGVLTEADLDIQSVQWEKLNVPSGVNLINRRGNFTTDGSESAYEGVVFNDSNYDFDSVEISVILFDTSNAVVGVNRTELRTLLSKTERSFKVSWPFPFPGVARTEVQASTNLFENSNFIKSYGTQERFQEFY